MSKENAGILAGDTPHEVAEVSARSQMVDLRTLEGGLSYLGYHAPTDVTLPKHEAVNDAFQDLWVRLFDVIPDGPGKTVALREIGLARMQCNSAIANGGM